MQLSQRFAHLFSSRIKNEGERYFAQRRVKSLHSCHIHFFAEVEGSRTYTVGLDYMEEAKDLAVSCSCPYYESNGVCKHIWAALLAAEKENALKRADHSETKITQIEIEVMEEIMEEIEADELFNAPANPYQPRRGVTALPSPHSTTISSSRTNQKQKNWRDRLIRMRTNLVQSASLNARNQEATDREALYIINAVTSLKTNALKLHVGHREPKKDGEWGTVKFTGIRSGEINAFPNSLDRQILSLLLRTEGTDSWRYYYNYSSRMEYDLTPTVASLILPMMSSLNRLFISRTSDLKAYLPVHYRSEEKWEGSLRIDRVEKEEKSPGKNPQLQLQLQLRNGEEWIPLEQIEYLLPGGLLLTGNRLLHLADEEIIPILQTFLSAGPVSFPATQLNNVLEELAQFPITLQMESTDAVRFETMTPEPLPTLRLRKQLRRAGEIFMGELQFEYDGNYVSPADRRAGLLSPKERQIILRNPDVEQVRLQELRQSGFTIPGNNNGKHSVWQIGQKKFTAGIGELIQKGWIIEAEGKRFRTGGLLDMRVSSGIDWFDLEGTVSFDQGTVPLPALLKAIAQGESTILLDDGSYGLLPEEWIKRYDKLARATVRNGNSSGLRFGSNQIVLLDMLLAELPEAEFDQKFQDARERLQTFEGVVPLDPPESFTGDLRPYQKIALGWFHFLRQFGFGGCLADDMGLGKTVQALALLEERRLQRVGMKGQEKDEGDRPKGPSLAVVPKSLIFNWMREAERFAPKLRVLDYTGIGRKEFHDHLEEFDLVLTTYGTLRRDIPKLRECAFDYLILDESQAIKNEKSATAKAARLLKGGHRLAMSGTPIENRIEELWSLFEFLNPGMLGSAHLFSTLAGSQDAGETRAALSRSLRPFILRRTKEKVAAELPEKVEQTIFCELDKTQRKLYNELRDYFRTSVLQEIDEKGMARSKIKVLEALLRLRQVACHPGLIDKKKAKLDCAKFDLLLPQLQEIVEEGHKALVFSQFTSFLGLLRPRLEAQKIGYVYLDGRTRDRQEKVEQFQNDPDSSLFLISLKAGGVGLNLTAAEYVFLLDPWWNPAVEAQAIDRTHRIGQLNNVFAYRLIAKDTVEEKVLQLQEEKRKLAEAIITGENALIRNLAREDLEMLLS